MDRSWWRVLKKCDPCGTNICWIIEKTKAFQKKNLLLLHRLSKPFMCGSQETLEILKEMGIPDHLTCLQRNLYAGQEATVRTGHEQQTGFKLGKE